MTIDIFIVTLILLTALALLISERLPYDLTAIGIMVVLMIAGILAPREAVAGFANPAPLTVGALFIVSKGLIRTEGLNFLTRVLAATTKGRPPSWAGPYYSCFRIASFRAPTPPYSTPTIASGTVTSRNWSSPRTAPTSGAKSATPCTRITRPRRCTRSCGATGCAIPRPTIARSMPET
ncbi:hypothetical protein GW813_10760 [bacterium]|nr:hypothetical protein [bacterium]PIV81901.1 MAG: hypothetical protein COW53_01830 [bacterium CG17_big_fil_post_rev_8_21_14_2_50_64_8]PJA74277.1 MAG: hypothetical protein CO151_10275 [bacterium CG_4_9_14_3_um_filter_65_15]